MIERLGEMGRRLWYLLNQSRFERELREEMDAHREMAERRDPRSGGQGPRFGNELRLREEAADQWGWAWLERLLQDVRFGARLLRRSPAFAATAIAVLSLGIGVNLAAFETFDAVALSWLPVRSPETLVNLSSRTPQGHSTAFSYPEFAYYSTRATSLASSFALVYGSVELNGMPAVNGEFVSANYFTDLGARPVAWRLFDRGDERSDAGPVLVLSETFWRAKFGADASLIGRTVPVNGHPFTVVGIVPSTFAAFHHDSRIEGPRRIALVASTIGITALLLAVTGLAGLIAFSVSQRTREVGVRLALGAGRRHVISAIVRQFITPIACGAIGGSALAAVAGTVLAREMFGISRFDPVAHGGALLLFAVSATLGALPSLRRALRVDPATTLRAE